MTNREFLNIITSSNILSNELLIIVLKRFVEQLDFIKTKKVIRSIYNEEIIINHNESQLNDGTSVIELSHDIFDLSTIIIIADTGIDSDYDSIYITNNSILKVEGNKIFFKNILPLNKFSKFFVSYHI